MNYLQVVQVFVRTPPSPQCADPELTSISVRGRHVPSKTGAGGQFEAGVNTVVTKKIIAEGAAASWTGLVQQPVQIVASHDLTLFVRLSLLGCLSSRVV